MSGARESDEWGAAQSGAALLESPMRDAIKLTTKQVPAILRHVDGYSGRKFRVEVRESFTVPSQAGVWDGGSCDRYFAVRMSDGAVLNMVSSARAPWDRGRRDMELQAEEGYVVVLHSIFCGKDAGLTFIVAPGSAGAKALGQGDVVVEDGQTLRLQDGRPEPI